MDMNIDPNLYTDIEDLFLDVMITGTSGSPETTIFPLDPSVSATSVPAFTRGFASSADELQTYALFAPNEFKKDVQQSVGGHPKCTP